MWTFFKSLCIYLIVPPTVIGCFVAAAYGFIQLDLFLGNMYASAGFVGPWAELAAGISTVVIFIWIFLSILAAAHDAA